MDGIHLILNEGTIHDAETKQVAIVLDLDAFAHQDIAVDPEELWNVVERLHVTVEETFEGAITERTRELIR